MAVVVPYHCIKCHKTGRIAVGSGEPAPSLCSECSAKEKDMKRREHFAGLEGLALEERIRRIEEWIYDYRPRYVPPMKF